MLRLWGEADKALLKKTLAPAGVMRGAAVQVKKGDAANQGSSTSNREKQAGESPYSDRTQTCARARKGGGAATLVTSLNATARPASCTSLDGAAGRFAR